MRALIISIILILLIGIGWLLVLDSVTESTDFFIDSLEKLSEDINNNNWESANNQFQKIEKKWNEIRDNWSVLLDHHEIDNIDLSMSKANQYVKSKSDVLSLGEIETLKKLFGIVKENESLTLTNIL
ncbi:DUF4363 family protein [Sporosalibacterium faouarense]|uniref:DUF4363 family protein n=1 Tax=Sporosalibacterium faouarense TaxID=516123 RepID=UPI00192B8854|nr:DUF4363 family protein [Sporosalibacterium faouarense]